MLTNCRLGEVLKVESDFSKKCDILWIVSKKKWDPPWLCSQNEIALRSSKFISDQDGRYLAKFANG